jgi:hypothetical protein
METVVYENLTAVPSTVDPNKWWVFSEYPGDIWAIGMIHNVSGIYAVTEISNQKAYYVADKPNLLEALQYFGEE